MKILDLQCMAQKIKPEEAALVLINEDLRDAAHKALSLVGFKLSIREPSKRVYRNASKSRIEVVMA